MFWLNINEENIKVILNSWCENIIIFPHVLTHIGSGSANY